jgi:putative membrane protein
MILQIPTRWIAVLSLLFAAFTWNACSKDHSFEKNNSPVFGDLFPNDDSTDNNDDDSTDDGGDDDGGGDTTDNGGNDNPTTVTDIEFMKKATVINRAQITNSALAQERGNVQATRDFAQAVFTRFSAAQQELDKLGVSLNVALPGTTDAAHQSMTNSLKNLEGRTFDVTYIDYQLLELQTAIDLYRAQIADGKNQQVIAYAQKYLPYLVEFQQTASNIRQSL